MAAAALAAVAVGGAVLVGGSQGGAGEVPLPLDEGLECRHSPDPQDGEGIPVLWEEGGHPVRGRAPDPDTPPALSPEAAAAEWALGDDIPDVLHGAELVREGEYFRAGHEVYYRAVRDGRVVARMAVEELPPGQWYVAASAYCGY